MDAADARRKLTARTRAVIPVHLYGHPVDMDPFIAMAAEHGLDIVEDAAEAHGVRYKGRRVGALGRIGAFSFYGNKIITTGEGGMVVTNDPTLAERAAFLRDHAMDPRRRYYHPEIGFYPGAEPSVDQSRWFINSSGCFTANPIIRFSTRVTANI